MLKPRWKKVFQDLWRNKLRTFLVVASISVGVFAVGTMVATQIMLSSELSAAYLQTSPGHAILFSDDITTGFVETLETVADVKAVDGRKHETVLIHDADNEPIRLNLISRLDYDDMALHTITPVTGQWPPANQTIVIERASLPYVNADIGDTILIEAADGQLRPLTIIGTAHDLLSEPVIFTDEPNGYINRETMAWLGYGYGVDELFVRLKADTVTKTEIEVVTDKVQVKLANSGRIPYFVEIFEPDVHPATEDVEPMILLLAVLAVLALFASLFLIINTTTSTVTRQTRQIGVMKAVGATQPQIMRMYLTGIAAYGLVSLVISVPLASVAAYYLTDFMAQLINFDLSGFYILLPVVFAQIAVACFIPLTAAFFPIRRIVNMSVQETLTEQASAGGQVESGRLDRWIHLFTTYVLDFVPQLQIAFRNALRNKGRLVLTMLTLTLGSAIFIGVMSVQKSMNNSLDEALDYFAFDVHLNFINEIPADEVKRVADSVSGVVLAETVLEGTAQPVHQSHTSMAFALLGVETNPQTIRPQIEQGRWLEPADTNAIVLDSLVLDREPDIQLGDMITLKVDGLTSEWEVVGFSQSVLTEDGVGYANQGYLGQTIGQPHKVNGISIIGQTDSAAEQFALAEAVRKQFNEAGYRVAASEITADIRDTLQFEFSLIVYMLVAMALLVSVVGVLGLAGTISINALERTREIGIMRAVGASNRAIRRIVVGESITIGLMGWFFGTLLAYPLGQLLTSAIGSEVLESDIHYRFATNWALYWLLIMGGIAVVASLWPARNASRVSVREALAYQ